MPRNSEQAIRWFQKPPRKAIFVDYLLDFINCGEGIDKPMRVGLFFTDLKVGYYPQMSLLLLVGVETWSGMLGQKFKGLSNGKPVIN